MPVVGVTPAIGTLADIVEQAIGISANQAEWSEERVFRAAAALKIGDCRPRGALYDLDGGEALTPFSIAIPRVGDHPSAYN